MAQEYIKKPIEVWLLTGYLGAGKTTALNHLLSTRIFSGRKTALVINEFGKVGIDGQLVESDVYVKFEINKGSIFCICTKTDFIQTFQKIRELKPDAVLIEATGVAEASDIEQLLSESVIQADFHIQANICIIDGVNYIKTAAFMKAAVSQVQWADGLVINKTDLLSEKEICQLAAVLKDLNQSARIIHTQFGKIEHDFLKSLSHKRREGPLSSCPPAEIPTAYIATNLPVNKKFFYETIDSLKNHILRLKGDVGFESGTCFVEVAGAQVMEKPACGKFETQTAFTVIGWKIEKQMLKDAFRKCMNKEIIEISKNSGDKK